LAGAFSDFALETGREIPNVSPHLLRFASCAVNKSNNYSRWLEFAGEIINSGNGVGSGASKLTGDVTQIIARLPPVLESLTRARSSARAEERDGERTWKEIKKETICLQLCWVD
jgi:hypothetical protein